jgi:hypothetical protein
MAPTEPFSWWIIAIKQVVLTEPNSWYLLLLSCVKIKSVGLSCL